MAVDPRYGNSSGYFKDPSNGEDLSSDTPRVIECELKDGKFVWPQVAAADGSQLLKIVYKLFTEEEKSLYKQYRGRGESGAEPREKKPRSLSGEKPKKVVEEGQLNEEAVITRFNPDSCTTDQTMNIIKSCDTCFGVSVIAGMCYALIGTKSGKAIHHIPREQIPDDEFDRICNGGL